MEDLFAKTLASRRQFLEQLAGKKEAALAEAPAGRLRCSTKDGVVQYYQVTSADDPAGKYISAGNIDLRKALAQKTYDKTVLRNAKEELKLVRKLEKLREQYRPERVYDEINPIRKDLITPILLTDEQFVKQWLEIPYQKPGFQEEAPEFYSGKGERMRSKTEVFIADKLDYLGIPYRYEQPLYLMGWGWIYPDFRVLNVRLRKEMIWEHFGKMDDEEYSRKNLRKLDYYQRNGWFPGENFIMTMETKAKPLSNLEIERIARHYLL